MAFKGTAGKSSSGASMSKYDVEVEARLQKLEVSVAKLLKDHENCDTGSDANLSARVDSLIESLRNFKQIKGLLTHL
tara:strand:- start:126 stop:356 length:231 start_codon:yes stop_codon:yes gene_type:complete